MPARLGKVDRRLFNEIIYRNLGARDASVVLGPSFGVDFGVLRLGDVDVIVEVDPVYVVPQYGWRRSSWFAVNILASDVAVSGVPPRYMFVDLNLPPEMSDEELGELWRGVSEECERLGISIVAGHTGRYEGVSYPMIGGATMVGVTGRDRWVSPSMARPGDAVIMTKGGAVEAAGILAAMFPDLLEREMGADFSRRAQEIFWRQSVVEDALALAGLGLRDGVHAMHDATEYGVWGALHDVSEASGVGVRVREDALFVEDDVLEVLRIFSRMTGIEVDPFSAISEGTLIAAVAPERADDALRLLSGRGIRASIIGEVTEGSGVTVVGRGGERRIAPPEQDPFWPLFFRAMAMRGGGAAG
ncbi:MAG: AIR synthase family protein [Conexivisphaera sp.]